jgi:hypothetical protein
MNWQQRCLENFLMMMMLMMLMMLPMLLMMLLMMLPMTPMTTRNLGILKLHLTMQRNHHLMIHQH